jgi:hypothetical protein
VENLQSARDCLGHDKFDAHFSARTPTDTRQNAEARAIPTVAYVAVGQADATPNHDSLERTKLNQKR